MGGTLGPWLLVILVHIVYIHLMILKSYSLLVFIHKLAVYLVLRGYHNSLACLDLSHSLMLEIWIERL